MRHIVVLDVGKTLSKLTLWSPDGILLERRTQTNERLQTGQYMALDAAGIEEWLSATLAEFAKLAVIGAIVPVGHGAAFALVGEGGLRCPPIDYEAKIPQDIRQAYDEDRDPFGETGSPALPDGLNLGAQIAFLEKVRPEGLGRDTNLLPWPQYWAWRLSGVHASEVTSLGCHSDLWRPLSGQPSSLAVRRGWADRLAPLRKAGDILGPITREWHERTGLPADVDIYCGLHDSNAALLAARGLAELRGESTVLSTGTWFVAMRTPESGIAPLPEARDCLINVDAYGQAVPSARFMGGREIEQLSGIDTRRIDIVPDQPHLVAAVPDLLAAGAMVLPSFAPGFGPFPDARGRWLNEPADDYQRRAAVCLYAALVADVSLDLIGARERLLVEGRFAEAEVFVRALAALRPDTAVYVANAHNDVSFGALRLINPQLAPASGARRVAPLEGDLDAYRSAWRSALKQLEMAA